MNFLKDINRKVHILRNQKFIVKRDKKKYIRNNISNNQVVPWQFFI